MKKIVIGFAVGFGLCIFVFIFLREPDKKTSFPTQIPLKSRQADSLKSHTNKSAPVIHENVAMEEEADEADSLMPIEWERPFLEIMTKKGQSMQERNDRLIKLATTEARGVPSVQEECLRHLAYGLSNEQSTEFLSLILNQNIPIELRKKFFSMLIEMKRPDGLIKSLCESIHLRQEHELLGVARARVENLEEVLAK